MTDIRADLARMPRYQCHKIVHALQISEVELLETADAVRLIFVQNMERNERFDPLVMSREWFNKFVPQAGGYFVVYQDGYQSYSPRKAFEEGYTRIPEA